eukprot:TRINITY_DN13537_c0_g1_i1.p1 TRINITY_DN13537_c0_g1~~TRINITY_DN13537_c0_g1_i1.p1  ORF type:complete len:188 (+),score=8.09 TRINITY_DN13537_c0_g1_i1:45-608(+)
MDSFVSAKRKPDESTLIDHNAKASGKKSRSEVTCHLLELPREILFLIYSFMNAFEQLRVCRVCKLLHGLLTDTLPSKTMDLASPYNIAAYLDNQYNSFSKIREVMDYVASLPIRSLMYGATYDIDYKGLPNPYGFIEWSKEFNLHSLGIDLIAPNNLSAVAQLVRHHSRLESFQFKWDFDSISGELV